MSDLISRDDLYHNMTMKRLELHEKGLSWNEFCRGFGFAMEFVKQAPSAEPERKTFHVIDKTTGKEADPYEIALNEDWAKSLCYCDMEGFAILEDGTLILADECGRFEYIQENDRFEIVWDEVSDDQ